MAVNSETEINLKTLQRVDSNIVEIIDNASQVAIYKYERKLNKWVSFLFVYFVWNLAVNLCILFLIAFLHLRLLYILFTIFIVVCNIISIYKN